ncbi:MAG: GNAT family N-acetyltransferase [Candidatus Hodarchaeales archaeon]
MDLKFEEATEMDIPELTGIMKKAFDDDARLHLGIPEGGPPGYDNGEFFRQWMLSYEESHGYKVITGDKIIGYFLVWIYEHGENRLGTIFMDPDYQNRGIGSRAMRFIFDSWSDAKSWILDTPNWATRNHYFYEKHGFKKIREVTVPEESGMKLFIFRKD